MFIFIRILTDSALLLWLLVPKCNVTMIRSERDNLRARYDRGETLLCRQCQIVWGSIESETMTSECDTEAVMYFDTCLLLRLIGPQCRLGTCGRWPVMRIWINIGCCWPLMVISGSLSRIGAGDTRVTSHTDNIRGLTMGLVTICLWSEKSSRVCE